MLNEKIKHISDIHTFLVDKGKVILCHGTFDVLHLGHIHHLKQAKELGDILIVSVTSDKYVNRGPDKPLFSLGQRQEMLAELESVDYVVASNNESAVSIIEEILPNIYVKGKEYKMASQDKKLREERAAVEKGGGKVVFLGKLYRHLASCLNLLYMMMLYITI